MAAEGVPATRLRRLAQHWGAPVALAAGTLALSVVQPLLLVLVPLSLLLLALPPRRPAVMGIVVGATAALLLTAPAGALWYVERGWVFVLGAWFLVMVLVLPDARFLPRALAALLASAATTALVLVLRRDGWLQLDWTIARKLQSAATDLVALGGSGAGLPGWASELRGVAYRTAELQVLLFPALLGLASLCALGLSWWLYRRLTLREERPLAPLREFRFRDELVWLLIAGLLLLVAPMGEAAMRAGSNMVTFMAALYALRGVAVLLAFTGGWSAAAFVFGAVLLVFLYPLVMLVGLTDTWLDLRARRLRAKTSN